MLACIHAYMHTCMRAYMRTCIHAYMHTCIHAYMHTCIHAYMHTCIHAYMHTCILAYMHTCIHAYIGSLGGVQRTCGSQGCLGGVQRTCGSQGCRNQLVWPNPPRALARLYNYTIVQLYNDTIGILVSLYIRIFDGILVYSKTGDSTTRQTWGGGYI